MPADEVVDVVDEDDAVVGSSTLRECLETGTLHRAVAVVLSRPGGNIVLQKRSLHDRWQPGRLTLSSTGHVKKGESYEAAAQRELREELGIDADVRPLGKMLIPPITEDGLTEREWVTLFSASSSAPCTIDRTELDSVSEHSIQELKSMLSGSALTTDAVILITEYLRMIARR